MDRFFLTWSKVTLVSIFLIIVAGGVVRMTDSGMGCPDWPKCFGQWIPPTDVSELPENYSEIYKEKYGYHDTTFNAFHTWTEYINRLIGFLSGNFCLILFVLSVFFMRKKDVWLIPLCFALLALMGFQAWLGARVVYAELEPTSITTHMLVALIIVALSLYIVARARRLIKPSNITVDRGFAVVLVVTLLLSTVQVLLGTQVRQEVDDLAIAAGEHAVREGWIDQLSGIFEFHRSFAILILLLNGFLMYRNWKLKLGLNVVNWLGPIVMVEAISGIVMAYMDIPKVMQPTHLVLAGLMFAIQAWALMRIIAHQKSHTLAN